MALISDPSYVLHALRLAHLRATDDPHSRRIISLSHTALATNAYVRALGLADLDGWAEIAGGLDSPPLEGPAGGWGWNGVASDGARGGQGEGTHGGSMAARRNRRRMEQEQPSRSYALSTANGSGSGAVTPQVQSPSEQETKDPSVSLRYSQTIGRPSGGFGMRVSQRTIGNGAGPSRSSTLGSDGTARPPSGADTPSTPVPMLALARTRAHKSDSNAAGGGGAASGSASPVERDRPRDRTRASTLSETPSAPGSAGLGLGTASPHRTPTTRTLSGLGRRATRNATGGTVPLQDGADELEQRDGLGEGFAPWTVATPRDTALDEDARDRTITRRPGRPRADSAPVLVVTSPGGRGGPSGLSGVDGQTPMTSRPSLARRLIERRQEGAAGTGPVGSMGVPFSPLMSALSSAVGSGPLTGAALRDGLGGAFGSGSGYDGAFGSILEQAMVGSVTNTGTGTSVDGDAEREVEGDEDDEDAGRSLFVGGDAGGTLFRDELVDGDEMDGRSDQGLSVRPGERRPSAASLAEAFKPRKVVAPALQRSALSALFNPDTTAGGPSTSASNANPFFSVYASVPPATGSSTPSLQLNVFFPHATDSSSPLEVTVRKDVTTEEVIGWCLACYWDQGRKPRLDEGLNGEGKDLERYIRLSTVGWALRIVEDDGEVDEDFPALDRDAQVAKFNFQDFAVVEATEAQIHSNLAKQPMPQSAIQTPSGQLGASRATVSQASSAPMSRASGSQSSMDDSSVSGVTGARSAVTSAIGSVAAGHNNVMVMLKVNVSSSADIRFKTTINVPSDMYFADIIELLIRKKHLMPSNPREWVLALGDASMALPLDRTVESLVGAADLALVRRSWAESHGLVAKGKNVEMRGGDPNTSIFKRMSEPPRQRGAAGLDFQSTYRKYVVQRKMPIGRHERILAIDGDYVHIMPSDNKAFFDSMKTSSFHVTSIISCKQSSKSPASFKFVVHREVGDKRYDFEADDAKTAAEIISSLRNLMKLYQSERNALQATGPARTTRVGRRL